MTLICTMKKIMDNVEDLTQRFSFDKSRNDVNVFFRGESIDYKGTSLMPSIFRKRISRDEERRLIELLEDYKVIDKDSRIIDRIINSQHYIANSRLLDITDNMLIALYFSCIDNQEKDGYVYIIYAPDTISPSSEYLNDYYLDFLRKEKNTLHIATNYKFVSPKKTNDRIIAQQGSFIFFPGDEPEKIDEALYERVKIKAQDKKKIIDELKRSFSISHSYLFPEKENSGTAIDIALDKYTSYNSSKQNHLQEVNSYLHIMKVICLSVLRKNRKMLTFAEKEDFIYRNFRLIRDDINAIVTMQLDESEQKSIIEDIKKTLDEELRIEKWR